MSFPYWRLYWNKSRGGNISYAGKTIEMDPCQVIMIPPYTAFSSRLRGNTLPSSGYNLEGARMEPEANEDDLVSEGAVLHLFIHFNLGMPYDFISPELFCFDVSREMRVDLEALTENMKHNNEELSFHSSLLIYKIIVLIVSMIAEEKWNMAITDQRMLSVLREIENHIAGELTNKNLSSLAGMAVNSFARLFKEEIGMPPQQFVRERRVQKTSILLHHSDKPIGEIAALSGFCDRFHLARVFKEVTSFSPAQYRKKFNPKS
jgi:AraC-like DNA-binding protein